MIFKICRGNKFSPYRNGHLQENRKNHILGDFFQYKTIHIFFSIPLKIEM